MKSLMLAAPLLVAFTSSAVADNLVPGTRHVISGFDYKIVSAAVDGVTNSSLPRAPLESYVIQVFEDPSKYVVVFLDPDRPEGVGGTSTKMFEFEVELNKDDLSLINWHGIR